MGIMRTVVDPFSGLPSSEMLMVCKSDPMTVEHQATEGETITGGEKRGASTI
jgi:hypothetical protein